MPKTKIDYSSTLFYMIFCKDTNIKDLYIGHTTNFVQRKHAHKQSCTNIKSANYPCKLYSVIRDNGGWDNWKMQIIAFHECENIMAAKKYEQKYFEDYDATLNSIEPMPQPKSKIIKEVVKKEKQVFHCNVCNVNFETTKTYETHNKTKKHIKRSLNPEICEIVPKNAYNFHCEKCDFHCSKECDWNRHILTLKHQKTYNKLTNTDELEQKNATNYECTCGNIYKHRQSLFNHKKTCSIVQGTQVTSVGKNEIIPDIDKELLVKMLLKNQDILEGVILKNSEVMEKMLEAMPQIGNKCNTCNDYV